MKLEAEQNLVPSTSTGGSKVFYWKMKGDYHRHPAEFGTGDAESKVAEKSSVACARDTKMAEKKIWS